MCNHVDEYVEYNIVLHDMPDNTACPLIELTTYGIIKVKKED